MSKSAAPAPIDHPELGPDPLAPQIANAFRSERLRYRGLERTDADVELLFRIKSEPEDAFNSYAGVQRPFTRALAREFLPKLESNILTVVIELDPAEALRQQDPNATAASDDPVPIGIVSLRGVFANDASPSRIAELGIDILSKYAARGYGRETIGWVLDWAFDVAGLHRVCLHTFSYNTRAIRAYEAVGFRRCGVEEETVWCYGKWWSNLTYGILDREWYALREQKKALPSKDN